jgi:hypothetical protein
MHQVGYLPDDFICNIGGFYRGGCSNCDLMGSNVVQCWWTITLLRGMEPSLSLCYFDPE